MLRRMHFSVNSRKQFAIKFYIMRRISTLYRRYLSLIQLV
ncbi:Protein of unknown function [Lactobacillus helveticus CIRM-BIA 951]|uniref:Uncharacterized protein n=1 Tax=Lactobacillus helveticus CIRM-BIA 951 TaxID=1226334 RepID=U6F9K0_LACHE|nr:Protein of unknown function [Lactobacillus helveticus CIRM-BIA 951]